MHIALNGWFWDRPDTGSGQYVRQLVTALRRIEPDIALTLVLPAPTSAPPPGGVATIVADAGRSHLGKVWFEQRQFPAVVARCHADIAHVPYWASPLTSPAPLITTVLDVIPLALPEYAAGFGARLYTSLVSATVRGSAHVITISDAARADIHARLGISIEALTTTHLAAGDAFHPRIGAELDEAVRQKYNLPDRFVLYMGGFDRRKNINTLLLAYTYVMQAEGEDYPLVMAGRERRGDRRSSPICGHTRATSASTRSSGGSVSLTKRTKPRSTVWRGHSSIPAPTRALAWASLKRWRAVRRSSLQKSL